MQDFQKRVVDEQSDLSDKIERLAKFLNEGVIKLDPDEQARLISQLNYMRQYEGILRERIAAFSRK